MLVLLARIVGFVMLASSILLLALAGWDELQWRLIERRAARREVERLLASVPGIEHDRS